MNLLHQIFEATQVPAHLEGLCKELATNQHYKNVRITVLLDEVKKLCEFDFSSLKNKEVQKVAQVSENEPVKKVVTKPVVADDDFDDEFVEIKGKKKPEPRKPQHKRK